MKISAPKIILITIILFLTIMPFFWLKPGEMDLGGDGGRLYFYDPINQIKNLALYYVSPFNIGTAEASFFYLPFFSVLAGLRQIIDSSYILISLNNAIKITVGFIAIYAIVKEFIGRNGNTFFVELASILAGLFYLSTPAMIENYIKALPTHNQVFLNPLMFYLFLRFFPTGNIRYMWIALIVSVIFAQNFAYVGAPPFFAFYPLALLLISLYSIFVRHVKLHWRKLLVVFILFFGLHAFHLIPEAFDLLTFGSNTNTRAFNVDSIKEQIGYFYAILPIPKTSFYLFSYSLTKLLGQVAFVIPLIIIAGLIVNKKKEKIMLLTSVFFLVTFFFVTGKITVIGIKIYEWFFHVPGFSMFRNFYGQWQFVYYFFYALLFGLAFYSVTNRIRSRIFLKCLFLFFVTFLTVSSWQFINGSLVNPFYEETNGVKGAIIMDPKYEDTLKFIRLIADDGKILVLPFSDFYMQVIHGLNNGAYVGHSTIGQLTGKNDFAGYQDMPPYSDVFWQLSKERDFESIKKMLGMLNIHYIFYNSDTRIYDTTFPGRPYSPDYVRKYMPANQEGYKEFIKNLSNEKIYESGFYNIYKIDDEAFLSHFYTPDKIFVYRDDLKRDIYSKASAFFEGITSERPVYIETQACKDIFSENLCSKKTVSMENNLPEIQFEKINPTKYKVKVFNSTKPYILVFSEAFHKNWKVYITGQEPKKEDFVSSYFNGKIREGIHKNIFFNEKTFETLTMKSLSENKHFVANGYANAWYISPSDIQGKSNYELIIEMTGQRVFYMSLIFSGIVFVIFILWGIKLFDIIKNK